MERFLYVEKTPDGVTIDGSVENRLLLVKSGLILLGYIFLFLLITIRYFNRKDILVKITSMYRLSIVFFAEYNLHLAGAGCKTAVAESKRKNMIRYRITRLMVKWKPMCCVLFIKAPVANVKVYYKKPDKLKIKTKKGFIYTQRIS